MHTLSMCKPNSYSCVQCFIVSIKHGVYAPVLVVQGWVMTAGGRIKHATLCLALKQNSLLLNTCTKNDTAQAFELLSNGLVWHKPSLRCLARSMSSTSHLRLAECRGETDKDPQIDLVWRFLVVPTT